MRVISTDFRKGIAPTYKYKVAGKDKAPHGKSREVLFAHIRLWSFRAEVFENNLKDDFFRVKVTDCTLASSRAGIACDVSLYRLR